MKHIHLDHCDSTQTYLSQHLPQYLTEGETEILVSTDSQKKGLGRQQKSWDHLDHALAFSFTYQSTNKITLIPLEINCLVLSFFKKFYHLDLKIKWPNDLLNAGLEKCGGIICQYKSTIQQNKKIIIVGIGLNLFPGNEDLSDKSYEYPMGYLAKSSFLPSTINNIKKELPKDIFNWIQKQSLSGDDIRHFFHDHCPHLHEEVDIIDGNNKNSGVFLELGLEGEAIIKTSKGIEKFFTGSLRFKKK